MGCLITGTNRHIITTAITVEKYLRNEVAKKDKMLGAKRLSGLIDHYTKLYENEKPDKPITISYDPIMKNNGNEMCYNNSIREHTKTQMQASA